MKTCIKCNLPENYHGIKFDGNQVCNFCNFYEQHKEQLTNMPLLEQEFQKKVDEAKCKAKENGASYDCIVGLSGGKDSTYIIYQLKHVYGMRVLAFTFDNGFSTEYGHENIKNALLKLDVDHIRIRMKESDIRKYYTVCVRMMHNFCSVCFHFMHYYSHLLASQYRVPLIVNGRTKGQILQGVDNKKLIEPFEYSYNLKDFEYQMFGRLVDKVDKTGKMDYLPKVEVASLSYFAYHDISEEETMAYLEKKIGWKRPDHGIKHADCWAHAMAEKMSIEKRGYPIRTGEMAVLVREGKVTKEQAAKELQEDREQFTVVEEALVKKFEDRIKK